MVSLAWFKSMRGRWGKEDRPPKSVEGKRREKMEREPEVEWKLELDEFEFAGCMTNCSVQAV